MLSSDSTTTKFYKTVEDAVFSYRWNVLQWPRYNQIRLADPTVMTALLDPSSVETRYRMLSIIVINSIQFTRYNINNSLITYKNEIKIYS